MAYDVLSDAKKRQQYDMGGLDEHGNADASSGRGFHNSSNSQDFSNIFGGRAQGGFPGFSFGSGGRGTDISSDIFEQIFQQMGQP